MLWLENVSLSVARGLTLINDANFSVNRGDKIGIVGRNGCGKSHLLEILAGKISPDSGSRRLAKDVTVLLVKQELPDDSATPLEYLKTQDPDLLALEEQLEKASDDDIGRLSDKLAQLEEERYDSLAPKILMGLGLSEAELTRPMRNLSGGLRMRIGLAMALVQMPDVLLLDEPTNHLDLESTQWLIQYLQAYAPHAAFVIVTHDIKLLEECCKTTVHMRAGELIRFSGTYHEYKEVLEVKEEKEAQRNEDLKKRIDRHEEIYYRFRKLPENRAAQAVAQHKKAEKLREQLVELVTEQPVVKLAFSEPGELKDPIIRLDNAVIGYGEKTVLRINDLSLQYGSKVGLLGRNGQGKSTLVRILAGKMEALEGDVNRTARLNVAYFSQDLTEELDTALTVSQQFIAKTGINHEPEVRSILGRYGFSFDKVNTLVGDLSGGEKSRLLFALICARSPNLIILDEPTNHLDVETREELVKAINAFPGTIVLVSHDWDLLQQTMSQFWLVNKGAVHPYTKGLADYQVQLQKFFTARALLPMERGGAAAPMMSARGEAAAAGAKTTPEKSGACAAAGVGASGVDSQSSRSGSKGTKLSSFGQFAASIKEEKATETHRKGPRR